MVGAQHSTPIVSGVPGYSLGYPWIIPLNTSGEEALMTTSGRMFQSRTVRGENNGDSHIMTMGCGKPDSFLVLEFTFNRINMGLRQKKNSR